MNSDNKNVCHTCGKNISEHEYDLLNKTFWTKYINGRPINICWHPREKV